jgi:hypothetical protein
LTADGTTLGADNGIAIAAMMALAEDDSVRHGPLELSNAIKMLVRALRETLAGVRSGSSPSTPARAGTRSPAMRSRSARCRGSARATSALPSTPQPPRSATHTARRIRVWR